MTAIAYRTDDPRHGSRNLYIRGCRCDECRAAGTAYSRERRRRAARVPTTPPMRIPRMTAPFCVYAYFAPSGMPLYVGQTNNIKQRHSRHRKESPWIVDAGFVAIIADADTRDMALAREGRKITELRPVNNKNGTDHARASAA